MRILMVTIMPPQPHSWGAIPVLLHGQLCALRSRHKITLVTLVGNQSERQAVDDLRRSGLEVHPVERTPDTTLRRMRMAASWLCGREPKRTIWNHEPRLQHTLNTILATRRFDLIQVEDLALGAYTYPRSTPKILTHYEVLRPRSVNCLARDALSAKRRRRSRLAPVAPPSSRCVQAVRLHPGVLETRCEIHCTYRP
jgi:hypothetical protein